MIDGLVPRANVILAGSYIVYCWLVTGDLIDTFT